MFSSVLTAIKRFFTPTSHATAMERYLAQSVDVYDLEQRERQWDQMQRSNCSTMYHWR